MSNLKRIILDGEEYWLCLAIAYNKPVNFDTAHEHVQLQPMDTEVAYCAGISQYAIIGFPTGNCNDDAGYAVVVSDFRDVIDDWLKRNNADVDDLWCRSYLMERHEMSDYHVGGFTGQWKLFNICEKER